MLLPSTLEVLSGSVTSPDGHSTYSRCDPLRSLPRTDREEILRAAVGSDAEGCLEMFLSTTGEFDRGFDGEFDPLRDASRVRVLGEELLEVAVSKKQQNVLQLLIALGAALSVVCR